MTAEFAQALADLQRGGLDGQGIERVFDAILAGAWTPVQTGAFVIALRLAGEREEHIAGAARALRAAMTPVPHSLARVVDTCGTGGDGGSTLNISTGAAVVLAACGEHVAKHGNRSISSRCGSADVLEAMGIPLSVPVEHQRRILEEVGIVFLMAPNHHGALRHAASVRRELGVRTIFNALGPLANPARATHQLIGVYEDRLRPIAARALLRLGTARAWVVRSDDGLDEVSPCAPTRVTELSSGTVREIVVTPEDFGLAPLARECLAGGDAEANARALVSILRGEAHPARDAVILNAAAALHVARGDALEACTAAARDALASGAAWATFERWRDAATSVSP